MGQAEVVDFLKKVSLPQSRKQIADQLKCDATRISHILKTLLKWNEVKFIEYNRYEASKRVGYILLRRTRFYYIDE